MKAAKIVGARQVVVRDYPIPQPKGEDVVVQIDAAPICGSDLHGVYERPGEKPYIPGHEASGVVVAVDRPRYLKEGDRVCLVSAIYPCGYCEMCRSGRSIYCRNSRVFYGSGRDGVHGQYALISEMSLERIPDWMSFEQAALILDPIGTPFYAYRRMGTHAAQTVGVFGLGPMGLGAVCVGSFLGAEIVAVEPNPYRRALALKLGAAAALDPGAGDIVDQVVAGTKGYGLDQAVECSGTDAALQAALDLVRPFGHVALVGENNHATIRPSDHFLRKEIVMSGSTCFPIAEFPAILRLYEKGLPGERIITHRFPIEQAAEAYAAFAAGHTGKVVLTPGGSSEH